MWAELLQRIGYQGALNPDKETLFALHECHVRSVPFENLDVQHQVEIKLDIPHLFHKVVTQKRGGFCYELNHLFYHLLKEIGFKVSMVSGRTYDDDELGPEFDHLALVIALDEKLWLVDVAFGDLFITPVEITNEKGQTDGRNYFRLEKVGHDWLLWMSSDGGQFEKKYQFSTIPRTIDEFQDQCQWKQDSPDSYFVKNTVVTRPTPSGRKSIFNEKLIMKENGDRKDRMIASPSQLKETLKNDFDIQL
ncbi:MAG: arylamine N-acetyltransferase [Cytophagales bacterium]|nr:arylamine N-acetyltransferase [Cytophagales bacterium]